MNFRYSCQVANAYLKIWGDWVGSHMDDWHGYPRFTPYLERNGGGINGSRMLIAPMPRKVALVSRIVEALPPLQREALWAHYVFTMRIDGRTLDSDEKAKIMRIPARTYQYRVSQGRKKVAIEVCGGQ